MSVLLFGSIFPLFTYLQTATCLTCFLLLKITLFNTVWGSPQTDKRGLLPIEMLDRHSAIVLNTGQATYQHYSGAESHLDIAIVDSVSAALSDFFFSSSCVACTTRGA